MEFHHAVDLVSSTLRDASFHFRRVPGSQIILRYIKNSYQNDPIRSVVELGLFLFAIHYLLSPRYSTKRKNIDLTEEEIDELVDDWSPEPLCSPPTELEVLEEERRPIISGSAGPKVKLLSSGRTVTNMASFNYFNLISNELIKERAVQVLRNYGVGACGPPNFYGTQDVHMDTEREIARFLGMSACIVYAQAFSTISSVIPAFSKRGDIIVADRGCNLSIQKGIHISRSTVRYYNHNDMEDLERVLFQIQEEQKRRPLTRRFIVTEGLFENSGDIADLPKLVELKMRYKYRLILDETHSFGVLGRTGRGLTEHQNVDPSNVEMLIGSLAHSLCAGGGFCAGSHEVVEHQRISSGSYVFSAALPAMLSVTAAEALKLIEGNPELFVVLRELTKVMRAQLEKSELITVVSAPESPRIMFSVKGNESDRVISDIVEEALAGGVLISRVKRAADGSQQWQYGGRLCMVTVSVGHSRKEVEGAGSVIRKAVAKVMGRQKK